MLLVAPTERIIHDILASGTEPWKISSIPELHGCDICVPTRMGIVGFQRKTLPDLVSSLQDGRLYYELSQMDSSATVRYPYLLVESTFYTGGDGTHYIDANISVSTFRSLVAKFATHHVGFLPTQSPRDTVECALSISRYLSSGQQSHIHRAKQLTNSWGQVDSEAYGVFLLQSFPGIGPKVAKAIYDHYGTVPIGWTVDAASLAKVPGIGRKRAETLIAALKPSG